MKRGETRVDLHTSKQNNDSKTNVNKKASPSEERVAVKELENLIRARLDRIDRLEISDPDYKTLRDALIRLPSEQELTKTLNSSRASVRSAIHELNRLGVIETKPRQANYISEGGSKAFDAAFRWCLILDRMIRSDGMDMKVISDTRKVIEMYFVRKAAQRFHDVKVTAAEHIRSVNEENRKELEQLQREMETADRDHGATSPQARDANREFHVAIGRLLGENLLLTRILDSLLRARQEFQEEMKKKGWKSKAVNNHQRHKDLLTAIFNGEEEEATKFLEEDLREGESFVGVGDLQSHQPTGMREFAGVIPSSEEEIELEERKFGSSP